MSDLYIQVTQTPFSDTVDYTSVSGENGTTTSGTTPDFDASALHYTAPNGNDVVIYARFDGGDNRWFGLGYAVRYNDETVTAVKNPLGVDTQTDEQSITYYGISGSVTATKVSNTQPSDGPTIDFDPSPATKTINNDDGTVYQIPISESQFDYVQSFWVDVGPATSSSLTVDPSSKTETGAVTTASANSITGLPSPAIGSIAYTDTDSAATVTGQIESQSVTAVDQNGAAIALTNAQQAQIEANFSLGTPSTAAGIGAVSWTFQPNIADAQIVPAGATLTISNTVELSDSDGNSDTAQVNVTESTSNNPTIWIVPYKGASVNVTEGGTVGQVTAQLSAPSTQSITVHTSLDPDSGDSQLATADFVIPAGVSTWTAPVVSATDDDITDDTQTGNLLFTASASDGSVVQFAQAPVLSNSEDVSLTVNDALATASNLQDITPLFTTTKSLLTLSQRAVSLGQLSGYFLKSSVVAQINNVGEQYGVALELSGVLSTYNQAYQSAMELNNAVSQANAIYDAKENAIVGVADALGSAALARVGKLGAETAAAAVLEALTEGAATPTLPVILPAIEATANWATDAVYDTVLKGVVDNFVRTAFEAANSRADFIQSYVPASQSMTPSSSSSDSNNDLNTVDYSSDGSEASLPASDMSNLQSSQNSVPSPVVTQNDDGSTTTQTFNSDGSNTFTYSGITTEAAKFYSSYSDTYASDGTYLNEVRDRNDGSHTVLIGSGDQTLASNQFDRFFNGAAPNNTFVFDPGYGLDTISQFRVNGTDHDTISLLGSDFHNSIAAVLHNAQNQQGGVVITDPTSGDTIKLAGITKAQLVHNQADFSFHA